jgi:general secretion pathway protein I
MKPSRAEGFTLIEALIAFAILALVLGAVFRSFSSGLEQERRAGLAVARVLEARALLEEFGASRPLEAGETEGALSTGETWTATVEEIAPTLPGARSLNLIRAWRVVVVVRDDDAERLRLATIRLGE